MLGCFSFKPVFEFRIDVHLANLQFCGPKDFLFIDCYYKERRLVSIQGTLKTAYYFFQSNFQQFYAPLPEIPRSHCCPANIGMYGNYNYPALPVLTLSLVPPSTP